MMTLELLLFTTTPSLAQRSLLGGVGAIVVDWERVDKAERQSGADTVVSRDLPADLERMRAAVPTRLICRLDRVGPWTPVQLELALALGADELLLPMVRRPEEVEHVLELARGRCGVGILIETLDALADPRPLVALPVSRVYVGLNDLAIERRTPSIFTALADGTVASLRRVCDGVPFGFGGMTVPELGHPIPATLMLGELLRLRADFTFLRRSFWRDVADRDAASAVASIHAAVAAATKRDAQAVGRDRAALVAAIEGLPDDPVGTRRRPRSAVATGENASNHRARTG
jgi:hypothetical protein